jgi:hypothetical protein
MTAPRYNPPTRVVTIQVPFLALVTRADPDFERGKFREPYFLDGRGRQFYHNPYQTGAYNRRGNVYPVGQPYGTPDPLVQAGLAPTVGNTVPGLYQAVAKDGWA